MTVAAVLCCVAVCQAARVEATSCKNGIGVVKLMGREAGFIASHAVLASGDVDLCLIPEVRRVPDFYIRVSSAHGGAPVPLCLRNVEWLTRRGHTASCVSMSLRRSLWSSRDPPACWPTWSASCGRSCPP